MTRSSITFLAAWILLSGYLSAAVPAAPVEIPLWPGGAPQSNGLESVAETTSETGWISNISDAVLYVYPAPDPCGTMVIACPGGGYSGLASWSEGHDWAPWMNNRGITYAVLKYRMPEGNREIPLGDARKAIAIARGHASEWGVSPDRIGIMGFSAGGHLAASLATLCDDSSCRPGFQILFYPVISMGADTHQGSRDNLLGSRQEKSDIDAYSLAGHVDGLTPPAILLLSGDDTVVPPSNSLDYVRALLANNVPVELLIYPSGGHGWGFSPGFAYSARMKSDLSSWLEDITGCKAPEERPEK